MKKSKFITLEGTDGAGKSTLMQHLRTLLLREKKKVLLTREPGGTQVSEAIRTIILGQDIEPKTELLLYEASRHEHVIKTILPALERGEWVLCDRYSDSSLAYQSAGRGIAWKQVQILNQFATNGLKPDLTLFLDVKPEIALARAKDTNRFELEGLQFQKRVRNGFVKAMRANRSRWVHLVAGQKTPEDLAREAFKVIERRFL